MDKNIIYIIAILAIAGLVVASFGYITFEGQISDLNGSVAPLEGSVSDVESSVDSLESSVTSLQTSISGIDSSVADLESSVTSVESSITSVELQLTNLTAIEGQLDAIEAVITSYQTSITDLEAALANYESTVIDLEQQVTEAQQQISDQQQQITDQQDQIDEYQETILNQTQQIEEYKQVTLVDRMGNVVTFTEPPERIVSLAPSNTEILFAIGAGDSVVGVTDYCDYPHNFAAWIDAGNMTSIGNYWNPSVEPIVALEPDLVLATSASSDAANSLKNLGYSVLIVEGKTIDDVLQDILLVGRATYNNAEASALVIDMRTRMDEVTTQLLAATTTPKVYHEVWGDPLMSVGPGTFIDELITLAGGTNIFNDATTSWPTISSEAVIQKNPDVMFFPDMYMGVGNFYETIEAVASRPGWDTITAVQDDALYEIDANMISRNGPRLVDALELIAQMVHPEIFGQP
jgi:iron complex transport system substrate-binding protein